MNKETHRVCPVTAAGRMEGRLRALIQKPEKILAPYVKEGMRVLDMGCGPGFFTLPMARMVGDTGRVVACDLQTGMLKIIADKIEDTDIQERITLHQCDDDRLNLSGTFDFALAFYVVHELPDQNVFFDELASLLAPGAKCLMVEPPIHVRRKEFNRFLETASQSGFVSVERRRVCLGMAAVLER